MIANLYNSLQRGMQDKLQPTSRRETKNTVNPQISIMIVG